MSNNYFMNAESGNVIEINGFGGNNLHIKMSSLAGFVLVEIVENGEFVVVDEGSVLMIEKDGRHSTVKEARLPKGRVARLLWAYGFTAATRLEWEDAQAEDRWDEMVFAPVYEDGHLNGVDAKAIFYFESKNIKACLARKLDGRNYSFFKVRDERRVTEEEYANLKTALQKKIGGWNKILNR